MTMQKIGNGRIQLAGGKLVSPRTKFATRRAQKAGDTYQAPTSIVLKLMAHGNSVSQPMHTSCPGFMRGHFKANMHLVGSVNGQTFPIQQDREVYWSDGSVRTARICFCLPVDLPADTEVDVLVTPTNGLPDRTPLISPAAMVALKDITLRAYGVDCGSVTYETSLRDIVTNGPRDQWGTNPLRGWEVAISGPYEVMLRAWTYRKDKSSGAYHKWIRDTIFVSYSINGDWEFVGRSEQPNWDIPAVGATLGGTTNAHCACFMELYDGSTLVHAWGGLNDVRTTNATGSIFSGSSSIALPSNTQQQRGQGYIFTGAGVPSGLTAGQQYWSSDSNLHTTRVSSITAQYGQTLATIGTTNNSAVTIIPIVSTFCGGGLILMDIDSCPVRWKNGASVTRTEIGNAWDEAYMSRGAKLFPSYLPSMVRYSAAQTVLYNNCPNYFPNNMPYGPFLSSTGDNPGDERVGYINHCNVVALLMPLDPIYPKRARWYGTGWGDYACWWRDPRSGRTLVTANGPTNTNDQFPQMGPNHPLASFNGGQGDPRFGTPNGLVDFAGYYDGYSSAPLDGSHCPAPWVVPAHHTGHPIYPEMGEAQLNALQLYCDPLNRNISANGKTFSDLGFFGHQIRGAGWMLRIAGYVDSFTPSAAPESAVIRHCLQNLADWSEAHIVDMPDANLRLGFMLPLLDNQVQNYMYLIWTIAVLMEVRRGERPGFRHYAEILMNFESGYFNDRGTTSGYAAGGNHFAIATPVNAPQPYITPLDVIESPNNDFTNGTGTAIHPTRFAASCFEMALTNYPSGFPYSSVIYGAYAFCANGLAKDIGLVSTNGDDCGQVYDDLVSRSLIDPCQGRKFSGYDYQHNDGPQMYPAFAISAALS